VKKAVIIGINYEGTKNELKGCVNDAKNSYKLLTSRYGYSPENIRILLDGQKVVDEDQFPVIFQKEKKEDDKAKKERIAPTKAHILEALAWLVDGVKSGDSLFLHYSGHGGQVIDKDGDESDGMDEVLYPLDFRKAGNIVDDQLYEALVKQVPAGVTLNVMMDCCHSGTMLDLPYTYHTKAEGVQISEKDTSSMTEDEKIKYEARRKAKLAKGASAGKIILFSGCRDDQTSADTTISGEKRGALSNAFAVVLARNSAMSYGNLLIEMRAHIEANNKKIKQIPQLSSNVEGILDQNFSP